MEALTLEILESQHPEYQAKCQVWREIDDLVNGGYQLEAKKKHYLPMRPGERPEHYEARLRRFTYSNVIGDAVAKQASRLKSGILTIDGLNNPMWAEFRGNTNRKGRSETETLGLILITLMKFGRCWLRADRPNTKDTPKSKAEEEALGLKPYALVYSPLEVTEWGDRWCKIRQIITTTQPGSKPQSTVRWTFLTHETATIYQHSVRLNPEGAIAAYINAKGEDIEFSKDFQISPDREYRHGVGEIPMFKIDLDHALWSANQAYLKAKQALDLENCVYDTAAVCSQVQRIYKPLSSPDRGDLASTYIDSKEEEIEVGNAFILKADSYTFSESGGAAVRTVGEQVKECHQSIRNLFGVSGIVSADPAAIAQSGLSKQMDYVLQELSLRALSSVLLEGYQRLLKLVAIMAGIDGSEISVRGMESFDLSALEDKLAIAKALKESEIEGKLAPTALRLFYTSLQNDLNRNTNAEQDDIMNAEIEELWAKIKEATAAPPEPTPNAG